MELWNAATLTPLKEWGKQSDELITPVLEKAINEKVTNNNEANGWLKGKGLELNKESV